MLPKPSGPYETYVNSLLMNDQIIVPVFNRASDAQALAVYERLGLKASGADSRALSNQGQGSVHCITMTYPKVPMTNLLKALGAREI
jgi:agmatine/peptidylarginine deiminase